MSTLPHWSSRFTPRKCSYGGCDKCIRQRPGSRQPAAGRQVIFSPHESCRTRSDPAAAAAACSQTATGSWLLSIVFDRAYRNKGFQKRGHSESVRRAFLSPPCFHRTAPRSRRHRGPILRFHCDYKGVPSGLAVSECGGGGWRGEGGRGD